VCKILCKNCNVYKYAQIHLQGCIFVLSNFKYNIIITYIVIKSHTILCLGREDVTFRWFQSNISCDTCEMHSS